RSIVSRPIYLEACVRHTADETGLDLDFEIRPACSACGYRCPPAPPLHSLGNAERDGVPQEGQGIEEVAFPGSVSANEDGERLKGHSAEADAPEATNAHSPKERRQRVLVGLGYAFFLRNGSHACFPRYGRLPTIIVPLPCVSLRRGERLLPPCSPSCR